MWGNVITKLHLLHVNGKWNWSVPRDNLQMWRQCLSGKGVILKHNIALKERLRQLVLKPCVLLAILSGWGGLFHVVNLQNQKGYIFMWKRVPINCFITLLLIFFQFRLDFTTFMINGPSTSMEAVGMATNGVILPGGAVNVAQQTQCLTDVFSVTNPGGTSPPQICGLNNGDHSRRC